MTEDVRYIRFNVTASSSSPATVTTQGLYKLQGWRKWVALLLRKQASEWREIKSYEIEDGKP